MDTLVLCARLDADINAALAVRLGDNINIGSGVAPCFFAIYADIVRPLRHAVQIGNLCQHLHLNFI